MQFVETILLEREKTDQLIAHLFPLGFDTIRRLSPDRAAAVYSEHRVK
jgi:hypothetical protein